MALATFEDANAHFDEDKIKFVDAADAVPQQKSADIVVRGRLGDVFPDYVELWVASGATPPTSQPTPELVREAASLLMASYKYKKEYSIEGTTLPVYAIDLERRAFELLDGIAEGSLVLTDADYIVESNIGELDRDDFWPNKNTTLEDAMYDALYEDYPGLRSARAFSTGQLF
jgi:hypothetical protein